VRDFHDIYIRIWDSGYSCQQLPYFTMGDKLSDNLFETLLLLKANAHINCVLQLLTCVFFISNTIANKYFVFCILDLRVEVFDESIF